MFVGVVGSDRNSRSNPPALIFMRVSFSGVIPFAVVVVSVMMKRERKYDEKVG
jgi:hypothetical protein